MADRMSGLKVKKNVGTILSHNVCGMIRAACNEKYPKLRTHLCQEKDFCAQLRAGWICRVIRRGQITERLLSLRHGCQKAYCKYIYHKIINKFYK